MFKIIKYIVLILIVLAVIYLLRFRFEHNTMEVSLKNQQQIENIKQKTDELKKEFSLLGKQKGQKPTETVPAEDKQGLDRFIQEHSK